MQLSQDQEEQKRAFFATIVTAVLRAADGYRSGGPPNEAVVASSMVDSLAFTQALILESHPRLRTDADIQKAVEQVAAELYRLITVMRKSTNETGTHPITDYGVSSPMVSGTN